MENTKTKTLKTGIFAIVLALAAIAALSFVDNDMVMTARAASVPTPKLYDFQEAYSYSKSKGSYTTHDKISACIVVDSIESYNIEVYRSTSKSGSYTLIDTIKAGSTSGEKGKCSYEKYDSVSLSISGVSLNKKYYYKIRLTDSSGNKGSYSNIKSYKLVFEGVTMTQCFRKTSTSVKLSWEEEYGVDGYQIYRKVSGGKWKKIKTIKKSSKTTYTDKKLKSGKTYKYKIRAYDKVNGTTKKSSYGDTMTAKAKTTVSGHYKSSTAYGNISSQSNRNAVRRAVQGFKDNFIKKGMTKAEKLEAVYTYIRNNVTYDTTTKTRQSAYGALVKGKANCSGSAYATMALCDAIGVSCRYIKSNSKSRVDHRWNEVKVNGKWYILDAEEGYFLVGSKTYKNDGWAWTAKNYPTVSKKDHKKGYRL